jgi:hypothetical protein
MGVEPLAMYDPGLVGGTLRGRPPYLDYFNLLPLA